MREFVQRIHFVGIGGSGMSGIAAVLLDQGYCVSGSDITESLALDRLRSQGAEISIGHSAGNLNAADVVVFSTAVSDDNPELIAAKAQNIPIIPRAEMLGELMRFRQGIAVAGTHGKTTTTSLIANILAAGGFDPTFVVGGLLNSVQGNAQLGSGQFLVAEADESDASFLRLYPSVAVVTNVDQDHMSTYGGDFERLKQVFLDFLNNLPFYGLAVLCIDDPVVCVLRRQLRKPIITYGFSDNADYFAKKVQQVGPRMHFEVHRPEGVPVEIDLSLPGTHNVLNALAAIAICDKLGVAAEDIRESLSTFQGIGRRFEVLGHLPCSDSSVILVDDYAHHPRELKATLDAARGCWPNRDLLVVFQPHRYSRTQDLFDDFVQLLGKEKRLILCQVYAAGEEPISGADGPALFQAIKSQGESEATYLEDIFDLPKILPDLMKPNDVLLTMGAGSIGRLSRSLCSLLGGGGEGSS